VRYTDKTFTLPTNQAQISQEEYEIRVGVRCPVCRKKMGKTHKCPRP
jgi:hypothetical protein